MIELSKFDASCYSVGVLYAIVTLYCIIVIGRIHFYHKAWLRQKKIHLLVGFSCLGRAILLFLAPSLGASFTPLHYELPPPGIVIFDHFPGLLVFSAFSVQLLDWSSVVHKAEQISDNYEPTRSRMRHALLVAHSILYIPEVVLLVLYGTACVKHQNDLLQASATLLGLAFGCVSIFLAIYAYKSIYVLKQTAIEPNIRAWRIRCISLMALIFCSAFIARGIATIYSAARLTTDSVQPDQISGVACAGYVLYYILLDIAPCSLLLVQHRDRPPFFSTRVSAFSTSAQTEYSTIP